MKIYTKNKDTQKIKGNYDNDSYFNKINNEKKRINIFFSFPFMFFLFDLVRVNILHTVSKTTIVYYVAIYTNLKSFLFYV